jgi:lysophospholipase L1-like esterase
MGANDASSCMSTTMFYNNMNSMIKTVTNAGKTPVIPLFNWSPSSSRCGQSIIDQIKRLWAENPGIVHGPDFWTFFKSNPQLVSSDGAHPTTAGMAKFRQMWAESALNTVYK